MNHFALGTFAIAGSPAFEACSPMALMRDWPDISGGAPDRVALDARAAAARGLAADRNTRGQHHRLRCAAQRYVAEQVTEEQAKVRFQRVEQYAGAQPAQR
jgi:hypothetical protein